LSPNAAIVACIARPGNHEDLIGPQQEYTVVFAQRSLGGERQCPRKSGMSSLYAACKQGLPIFSALWLKTVDFACGMW
jgi:hypothetical protein